HGRLLRARTALGSVTRSIGSLAVDELLRHLREPTTATVLVVGAGEIGKLACRALRRRVGRILVVSRGGDRARAAAAVAAGEVVALQDMALALDAADGVLSAADTRGELLTADRLGAGLRGGARVVVDIALPASVPVDGPVL